MTYRFETFIKNSPYLLRRYVFFAFLLLGTLFAAHSAQSASAFVNFTGYVMPQAHSKTISYPQSIVSFSDKVALPVFGNGDDVFENQQMSVISGRTNKKVHFETIHYSSKRAVGVHAVVLDMLDERQTYYLCQGNVKSVKRGCVRFNVIKAK